MVCLVPPVNVSSNPYLIKVMISNLLKRDEVGQGDIHKTAFIFGNFFTYTNIIFQILILHPNNL